MLTGPLELSFSPARAVSLRLESRGSEAQLDERRRASIEAHLISSPPPPPLQVVGWPLNKSGVAEFQCLMVLRFLRQMLKEGKVVAFSPGLGISR